MTVLTPEIITSILDQMETQYQVPYAYLEFDNAPGTDTFIAYYEDQPDQFGADDKVWFSAKHFTIELYTPGYDPGMECNLTDLLDEAEIFWRRGPQAKIDSENMIQTVFYL